MDKNYILEIITLGMLDTNCYIIADAASKKSFIIDPGDECNKLIKKLDSLNWEYTGIINTHSHADHIGANKTLKIKYKLPIYIHKNDSQNLIDPVKNGSTFIGQYFASPEADNLLEDGDVLELGKLKFTVIHTPGHTPGGICLKVEDLLFTGDTLFYETIGRCDFPGGNKKMLMQSLAKLKLCNPESIILPGHGCKSTLKHELKYNPYLLTDKLCR